MYASDDGSTLDGMAFGGGAPDDVPPIGAAPGLVGSACAAPETIAEALAMTGAGLDYLNSPAAADAPAAACGQALTDLAEIAAKLAAAQATFLGRFDAAGGPDADGYGSASAWLTARAQLTSRDARAAVRRTRTLNDHQHLADALANGQISPSWAAEIATWTKKLPAALRGDTDRILLQAAAGGASLEDLGFLATRAYEQWRSQRPDPDDDPDKTFKNRHLQLGTTLDGAGRLTANLTPECAEALKAVLESLGKKQGPEDDRTAGERFHDALQEGCELLIRAKMVPDRAGADTHVHVHIPLSQLRDMPGATDLETAWINAQLGEHGYLTGKDAEAAACDALFIPIVTGHADMTVIDQIIDTILTATASHHPGNDNGTGGSSGCGNDDSGSTDGDNGTSSGGNGSGDAGGNGSDCGHHGDGTADGNGNHSSSESASPAGTSDRTSAGPQTGRPANGHPAKGTAPAPLTGHAFTALPAQAFVALSPQARRELRTRIARLAIDYVSGPGGIASTLRTGLLPPPYNTVSLPLDIGYSENIPEAIRRAVILRDKHCSWPKCRRPAAACDVHHIIPKKDGGKTSVTNCALLCQYHHDVCIHRQGWTFILHPDGTTEARSPAGQILRSNGPPTIPTG